MDGHDYLRKTARIDAALLAKPQNQILDGHFYRSAPWLDPEKQPSRCREILSRTRRFQEGVQGYAVGPLAY
jgi:hypothetical protein